MKSNKTFELIKRIFLIVIPTIILEICSIAHYHNISWYSRPRDPSRGSFLLLHMALVIYYILFLIISFIIKTIKNKKLTHFSDQFIVIPFIMIFLSGIIFIIFTAFTCGM